MNKYNINKAVDQITARNEMRDLLNELDISKAKFIVIITVGEETTTEVAGYWSRLELMGLSVLAQDALINIASDDCEESL